MTSQRSIVQTLLESMPYIQRFSGKTIVIKYGGAAMTSRRLQREFARDVVLLKLVGMRPVVVHGGGPQVTKLMKRLGMEARFVRGHRVTDEQTMEVAKMVLVGKVNKELVGLIHAHGGTAVGLSGEDGRLLLARRLEHRDEHGQPIDMGLVGEIVGVDTTVLDALAGRAIPVVASIGADATGQAYNINADAVAGALATALHAEKLVLLTDVEGVLTGENDDRRPIVECDLEQLAELEASGAVSGGMLPKLAAARRAVEAGVTSAHVVDGRVDHALLLEILTDAGCGTKIVRTASPDSMVGIS